jgi:formylmethanofuran dehydrogenase subunit E
MGKERCAECGEEIAEEHVFHHERKAYCLECTVEHMRNKHAVAFRTAL